MRIFIFFCLIFTFGFCDMVENIKASSNVTSINLSKNKLYISTDGGFVEIYDINLSKFIDKIELKNIKTYFGDERAKVFNTDVFEDRVLVLSQGDYGTKRLMIKDNEKSAEFELENEGVKKALFVNSHTIALATLSNEIYFYDTNLKSIVDSFKFSTSALSDFEISKDKTKLVIGCESGKIYIYDINSKKISKEIALHKDNIYDVEISNDFKIASGSTDRSVGLLVGDEVSVSGADFLVYSVGVSDEFLAYMDGENSEVSVVEIKSGKKIAKFDTNQSTLHSIKFTDNSRLITSAYEQNIYIWRF